MTRLTQLTTAHPWRTLLATAVLVAFGAAFGGPVLGLLQTEGGFSDGNSDSSRAALEVERATGVSANPEVVVLVELTTPFGTAGSQNQIKAVADELGSVSGIASVASASDPESSAQLVSEDGNSTYLAATLSADAESEVVLEGLDDRFGARDEITLGGVLLADSQLDEQVSEDLARAEMLALPLLILLSFIFFRGFRAALMPLVVGISTILLTFLILRGINEVYGLSIFSANLVIGLGIGLAIDYTLFLLTRYREELERSGPGAQAIQDTMATAGRTVVYSAVTVALALMTLVVFPLNFLQSMGIGGATVSLSAALASLIITPVFFALWSVKLKVRERRAAHDRWYRVASVVMGRPGLIAVSTALLMIVLTIPALRAVWAPVDVDTVPQGLSSRTVGDALQAGFPSQDSSPIVLVTTADRAAQKTVYAFADQVARLKGVESVKAPETISSSSWRTEVVAVGGESGEASRETVEEIRAIAAPVPVLVGGEAADFLDQQAGIAERMPLAILLLASLTFVLLWLMTGSVILPLKALLMNVLTVGSTLGLLTLIFQDGRFEALLGYSSQGGIVLANFLVTSTIVFALSTDYGVFLLGRIKEAHDAGMKDREAVATALARTGAVVTAAAVLLAVAIGAFVTSEVLFIKQIGVGVAVGVLIDALVVRALLVPSLMALLGPWNWWSPKPLRKLHARIGLGEGDPAQPIGDRNG